MQQVNTQNAVEVAQKVKAGEVPGPAKSLAEAMNRVMQQVGYIQKKGTVSGFGAGYKFAGEAQFIEALRPELVAQGIVVCPVGMESLAMEIFHTSKGTPQNRIVLRVTFRFTHVGSGQTLDVVTCGEGIDNGDKATNKAMTGAMKYALRQAFCIETGNDPDETPSSEQERCPQQQQAPKSEQVRDNPQLRAKHTQAYAQAKTREDALKVRKAVVTDIEGKRLSDADAAALRAADADTMKQFPAPAKA